MFVLYITPVPVFIHSYGIMYAPGRQAGVGVAMSVGFQVIKAYTKCIDTTRRALWAVLLVTEEVNTRH